MEYIPSEETQTVGLFHDHHHCQEDHKMSFSEPNTRPQNIHEVSSDESNNNSINPNNQPQFIDFLGVGAT